jgi:hypothetical protein
MLHGTRILPAHLVVGNPAVLGGAPAVGGQFGVGVDGALEVVVLHPAHVAHVAYVQFRALEGDARGDKAVEFVGPYPGMEETIDQSRLVEHLHRPRQVMNQ